MSKRSYLEQDEVSYRDDHGRWCKECGNGVRTSRNGKGHVCPHRGCSNYDVSKVPEDVIEAEKARDLETRRMLQRSKEDAKGRMVNLLDLA